MCLLLLVGIAAISRQIFARWFWCTIFMQIFVNPTDHIFNLITDAIHRAITLTRTFNFFPSWIVEVDLNTLGNLPLTGFLVKGLLNAEYIIKEGVCVKVYTADKRSKR